MSALIRKYRMLFVLAALFSVAMWMGNDSAEARKKGKKRKRAVISVDTANLNFSGNVGASIPNKLVKVKNVTKSKKKKSKFLKWSASSDASWLSVSPSSGKVKKGKGSSKLNVSVNTAGLSQGTQTGKITITGNANPVEVNVTLNLTVNQAGCSYKISSANEFVDFVGGTSSFNVETATGCQWTAQSSADWLTITSGASGSGNGTVQYSAAANNSDTPLSATISVAGLTHSVAQNARVTLRSSVHGIVQEVATGSPVSGATVYLTYDKDGNGVADTVTFTTGASGEFLFADVPVLGGNNSAGLAIGPGANAYTIVVIATGYATSYGSVFPFYNALIGDGTITNSGDLNPVVVSNLAVDAGIISLRRPGATATGRVIDGASGVPLSGVTVKIAPVAPITHDIITESATTNSNGRFTFTDVPELGSFSFVASLSGYTTSSPVGGTVGSKDTILRIDSNVGDVDPETPIPLLPIEPVPDLNPPHISSTSINPGQALTPSELAGPFTFTWSEPMDSNAGKLIINTLGFKGLVPATGSWDSGKTTYTLTPVNSIPKGMIFEITGFSSFRDANSNFYNGQKSVGTNDNFLAQICGSLTACSSAVDTDSSGVVEINEITAQHLLRFSANGDPALLTPQSLAQDSPLTDTLTGLVQSTAKNANNENNLAATDNQANGYTLAGTIAGATSLGSGNPIMGDALNESDSINLSWSPPVTDTARAYNIYAEHSTGGFINGLPVQVRAGAKSANPDEKTGTTPVSLSAIQTAIGTFNTIATTPIPTVTSKNTSTSTSRGAIAGTLGFFDNGFSVNMGVTAINQNGDEGQFSNIIIANDNTPPMVKEQADTVAGGVNGFGWSALSATNTKQRPLFLISDSSTAGAGTPIVDTGSGAADSLIKINPTTHPSSTYGASEWTSFLTGKDVSFTVTTNEDLSKTVTPTISVTDSAGTPSAITATVAIDKVSGLTEDDSNRELKVTMSKDGLAKVVSGDRLSIGVTDEAGNSGISELQLVDGNGPFITSAATGRVVAGSLITETLTVTFFEPVTKTDAEAIGNWTDVNSAAGGFTSDTVSLSSDRKTATLTASAPGSKPNSSTGQGGAAGDYDGFIATTSTGSTPIIASGVTDDSGNFFTALGFNVTDGIKPRVMSTQDTNAGGAGEINSTAQSDGDGIWSVDDDASANADTYNIRLAFTENIFTASEVASSVPTTKVSATISATGTAVYSAVAAKTVVGQQSQVDLTFSITGSVGVVAAGDKLNISVTDQAGNTGSNIILELGAAAAGLSNFVGE